MTLACMPVDGDAGVVLRLAANAECAAQAIGSDGFQAVIGGPVATGLLSALVTIFVALLGYRLVLGTTPGFGEGMGRLLRLGFVLALVTGWPAFQTLVYRTATEAPEELAATILPAAGLSATDLPSQVQAVYDAMRLGANGDPRFGDPQQATQQGQGATPQAGAATGTASSSASSQPGLGAMPQSASVFAVVTTGTISALHLAIGFLLAVAPLAILGLLFDGTLGLFNGWLRALVGAALAGLAATIVTAVALIPIEQEIGRLQGWRGGGVLAVVDSQAVPTLVLASAVAMLVAVLVAIRMGGALRYAPGIGSSSGENRRWGGRDNSMPTSSRAASGPVTTPMIAVSGRDRATGVAEALAMTVRREQRMGEAIVAGRVGGRTIVATIGQQNQGALAPAVQAAGMRRTTLRRSRSATARDRVGQ